MITYLWFVGVQLILTAVVIEIMVRNMPKALRKASRQICYRLDGTLSEHRETREFRARNRLRLDLLAVIAYILLVANGLYFFIDRQLIPIDLALSAVGCYDADTVRWKNAIRAKGIDDHYAAFLNEGEIRNPASQQETMAELFRQWPAVVAGVAIFVVGCLVFFSYGTMKAYRDFSKSLSRRADEQFRIDLARLSIDGSQFTADLLSAGGRAPGQRTKNNLSSEHTPASENPVAGEDPEPTT